MFTKLLGLQYRIVYKPGTTNRAADVLSRNSAPLSSCAAISAITPQWIHKVVHGYSSDSLTQAMIAKLLIDPASVPQFTLRDGVLRYQNRIWIGANPELQQKILDILLWVTWFFCDYSPTFRLLLLIAPIRSYHSNTSVHSR